MGCVSACSPLAKPPIRHSPKAGGRAAFRMEDTLGRFVIADATISECAQDGMPPDLGIRSVHVRRSAASSAARAEMMPG